MQLKKKKKQHKKDRDKFTGVNVLEKIGMGLAQVYLIVNCHVNFYVQ